MLDVRQTVRMLAKIAIDPNKKLVDAVAEWLALHIKVTPEGVKSLRHLLVVVPTAQSGRNLRLTLAKMHGAVLPPKIMQPVQLVRPRDESAPEATAEELAALFLRFLPTIKPQEYSHIFSAEALSDTESELDFLSQLNDIWRILAGQGRLMDEVAGDERAQAVLAAATGDEPTRWEELGNLERAFFAFLHARNLRHPAESMHLAKLAPAPLPDEVEEIVLPALADPIGVMLTVLNGERDHRRISVLVHSDEPDRFDEWGRPKVSEFTGSRRPRIKSITEQDIVIKSNAVNLASSAAEAFKLAGTGQAQPVVSVADESLMPDLAAAFLNEGFELHDSGSYQLANSSLGRLAESFIDVYAGGVERINWKTLVGILRSGDMMAYLEREHGIKRAELLRQIDEYQNGLLPVEVTKDDHAPAEEAIWALIEKAPADLPGFLRSVLRTVFRGRTFSGREGEQEFREALVAMNGFLAQLSSAGMQAAGLSRREMALIARRSLDRANFMLESDSPDAVKTEGWLELPWSLGERFLLAGLHEGSVPDSVLGHPFMPDSLREALGLVTNEQRLARDSWILEELCRSHDAGAIKAYIAKTTASGDICRPSRLLMLCDEADLPHRAEYLFGDLAEQYSAAPRQVAEAWRLKLPEKVELKRLSASAIDSFLRCPFTFLFTHGLKMRKFEEKFELDEAGFGSVVHAVLEKYALAELARRQKGEMPLKDVEAIQSELHQIIDGMEIFRRPGNAVGIQLRSLRGRLDNFARVQAKWAQSGWRVEAAELKFATRPFIDAGLDIELKGFVDRIDYHPGKQLYRIIDYKTWDERTQANSHVFSTIRDPGKTRHLEFAKTLGLPVIDGKTRFLSIQLLLYAHALRQAWPEKFAHADFDCCYLVLGESLADTVVYGSREDMEDFEAQRRGKKVLADYEAEGVATAIAAIKRIKENVFWPPGPDKEWEYDLKDLLVEDPEKDLTDANGEPCEWLRRQLECLKRIS